MMRLILLLLTAVLAYPADSAIKVAIDQATRGDYQAAIDTLTPLVRAGKAEVAVYGLLAECKLRVNQPDEAAEVLRQGLKVHAAAAPLEKALGQVLFRKQPSSSEAGTLLGRAAKALPQDPEVRHYFAQWNFVNSRERICIEQERAALKLPGLNDLALLQMNTLLGMCASRIEDASTAKAAFEASGQVNRRLPVFDPIAAFQYVDFLKRYGDDKQVETQVDEILRRVPRFGPALLEQAKHFDRAGRREDAIKAARLTLEGTNIDINTERAARGILARSYLALGDTAAAEREQQWIEAHPNPETPLR